MRAAEAFTTAALSGRVATTVTSSIGRVLDVSASEESTVPGPVPTSPANRDYKPGFAASLMLKDLKLAQEAAASSGAVTPMGAEAAQLYALYAAQGGGDADFSGIIRFLRGDAT